MRSFLVPGGAVLFAAAGLAYSGWLTLPVSALTFLSYCGLFGGMLLAWRFHSSRVLYCLFFLFLVHQGLPTLGPNHIPHAGVLTALHAIAFLAPFNYVLIIFMEERGLTLASFVPVGVFLFVQSVIVSVLWRSAESGLSGSAHLRHPAAIVLLPNYIRVVFFIAVLVLAVRFLLTRKAVDSSSAWSLGAVYLCIRNLPSTAISELYFAAAACILVFSIIENSYLLAYHDELTSLPSRRAFNDATMQLRTPYSLAVIDIDHFKRFNDTYGHDVGDQVLKLVAAKLAGVTGGGQAYRCGGEEFTIVFSNKTLPEVTEHLERLRLSIESAEFRMRGQDRRQSRRGPDRRNERPTRSRTTQKARKKKDEPLHFAKDSQPSSLSVTVSIGVSSSESLESNPQLVMEAADKALYRAKESGRNRMEIAPPKSRPRLKTAGIA